MHILTAITYSVRRVEIYVRRLLSFDSRSVTSFYVITISLRYSNEKVSHNIIITIPKSTKFYVISVVDSRTYVRTCAQIIRYFNSNLKKNQEIFLSSRTQLIIIRARMLLHFHLFSVIMNLLGVSSS